MLTSEHPTKTNENAPLKTKRDYAEAYAKRLGWAVFPLHWIENNKCSCGDLHCKSPGKHPITELAPRGVNSATCVPEIIAACWTKAPNANIGVAMGAISGVWALDIDPRNGGEETIEQGQPLPETVEAITGGGGRHLVYLYNSTKKPISPGQGVDVKSDGGYIVVEPSNHIEGNYVWEGSSDPFYGCTPSNGPEWIYQKPKQETASLASVGALTTEQVTDIRSALAFIPAHDYNMWVKIGQCLHSSKAPQAFGLWDEWSQKAESYDPNACASKWPTFTAGKGLNIESIFTIASENGWVNPNLAEAVARKELQELAQSKVKVLEREEQQEIPLRRIPIPFLDSVCDWIQEQSAVYYPHATVHSVLSFASAIASRQYISETGVPAHVYLGITSHSIGDIRALKTKLQMAMNGLGQRDLLRGTRLNSPQSVYKTIIRTPSVFYISDDYGQMLSFTRRQQSGLIDQVLNIVSDMYSCQALFLDPDVDPIRFKDNQAPVLYNPCMSMLTLVSNDQFGNILRRAELGRGSLEQFLYVEAGEQRINDNPVLFPQLPSDMVEYVSRMRVSHEKAKGNLSGVTDSIAMSPSTPLLVPHSPEVHRVLLDYESQIKALAQGDPKPYRLCLGMGHTMRRLLVTLAAWSNPENPRPTVELAAWCGAYVLDHARAFLVRYQVLSDDDAPTEYTRVLTAISEAGANGLTERELRNRCRAFRALKLDQRAVLLETLKEDNEVFPETKLSAAGRNVTSYVYKGFIKNE